LGLVLLLVGIAAYAAIPSVHMTPVVNTTTVWTQTAFPVEPGTLVEQPRNITVFAAMTNVLKTNLTVTETSKSSSSTLRFQLLRVYESASCSVSSRQPSILFDQSVSNQSFSVPLNATGTYCFVFDNQGSQTLKNVDISASVTGTSVQVKVARDGSANEVGLGLGAVGLAVAAYGYSRKTVIPWA